MQYGTDNAAVEAENYGGGAGDSSSVNVRHYWYVLLERRWLVICAYLAVLAAAGVYLYTAPRIYRATSRLQIDPEVESSINIGGSVVVARDPDYLQTQYRNLGSRSLLQAVVRKERLSEDPRYSKDLDVVRALGSDLSVSPVRMTRLVDVSVEHTSPQKAASIANTLADEFIDWMAARRMERSSSMLFFLRNQVSGLEGEVSKAEEDLHNYRMRTRYVSLEKGDSLIAEALSQSQQRYVEARARAQVVVSTTNQLAAHVQEGKTVASFPPVASDPQITTLQGRLATQQNELAGLLQRYREKHPAVIQARSQIEETQRAIDQQAQQVLHRLIADANLASANANILSTNVVEWESRQMEWNRAKMEYDVLSRKAETKKALYNAMLARVNELDIGQRERLSNIRVVDRATPPPTYVKPSLPITIALAAVGGLAVALGLALFVNFLDDSVKSQDDVETYLRLPFLGYIPNIKSNSLNERYQHSHLHPQSNSSESFRTIRAAITLGTRGDKLKILTVTSSIPAEGKSTVASNLAIVVAQTGLRTLLVDADLRRPTVHQGFSIRGSAGLVAYLAGKVQTLEEVADPTDVPNLEVVCCGSTPSQPSELLSSRRMAEFVQEAARRYDRVIIDCPPVSAVSDPLIVSSLADGAILVTKFNRVRRDMARKSIQRMIEAGVQLCGVVINDIDFEGREAYYYSYYYQNRYYKGYYHGRSLPVAPEPAPAKSTAPVS